MSNFTDRLYSSTAAVGALAAWLVRRGGYDVYVPAIGDSPDQYDLLMRRVNGSEKGPWKRVEVKHRHYDSDTLAAFPTLYVLAKEAWDKKPRVPSLVFTLADDLQHGFMLDVPQHYNAFKVETIKDNERDHTYPAYTCPTKLWQKVKLS